MTNLEFSNEFDVLYNNITSNQAPGLNEYEKSVFLTKAQDEIVKSYFNPKSNKLQDGFDGSERRQIDFSMILNIETYRVLKGVASPSYDKDLDKVGDTKLCTLAEIKKFSHGSTWSKAVLSQKVNSSTISVTIMPGADPQDVIIDPFITGGYDYRKNSKLVTIESDILLLLNESVIVERADQGNVILQVRPISYREYEMLMSKPHARPLKKQAWRLLCTESSRTHKQSNIIVGPSDSIVEYRVRYIRRPRAIRLISFDDVTLGGGSDEQSCELDPILHPEILQRAVELAKSSYMGDLQSQIALGQNSHTEMGILTQSK